MGGRTIPLRQAERRDWVIYIYIYTVKEIDRIVFMVINYPGICSRMLSLFFFLVMELFSRFQNCGGSSSTSSDRRCLSRECISRNISAKCKSLFHLKARYIYKRLKTRGSGKGQIFRKRVVESLADVGK